MLFSLCKKEVDYTIENGMYRNTETTIVGRNMVKKNGSPYVFLVGLLSESIFVNRNMDMFQRRKYRVSRWPSDSTS